jgi:proton-dependent oligopeptide transporter, POT family
LGPVPEQLFLVITVPKPRRDFKQSGHGRDNLEVPERELFGHPRGLSVLFATETWERFSYFGNSALVVLYMVQQLLQPGRIEGVIGFAALRSVLEAMFGPLAPQPFASQLFGFYTGLAYSAPVIGGLVADRILGERRTVVIGGLLMAVGHFMMAFEALFLPALACLILGVGAFKPNISTQVGALYPPDDQRRSRGYAIFYVGINIGAFLAPLVCGTLAVAYGWHTGFAAAGVGMLISLGIYLYGSSCLPPDRPLRHAESAPQLPLSHAERRSVVALCLITLCVSLFWAAYDQQGNTIVLWAEDFTDRVIDLSFLGFWRGDIPTTWFLALNPLMIFVFTPVLVRLWAAQARRGTESLPAAKMALGCAFVTLASMLMSVAAWLSSGDKASAWWLVGYFALATIGELLVAPIGLALISIAAPARLRARMMGLWFAATLPGDILAGWLGGFWSTTEKARFFLLIAAVAAFAGVALWALSSVLRSAFVAQPSGD